jgi:hypothetical protein
VGGLNFGGVWRGAPAVVGDWSRAGLRIVGAVAVSDENSAGARTSASTSPVESVRISESRRMMKVATEARISDTGRRSSSLSASTAFAHVAQGEPQLEFQRVRMS